MQIDVDRVMTTLDGQQITYQDGKPLTLRTVCIDALLKADDPTLKGTDKLRRYQLAQYIDKGGAVELSSAEIQEIKDLVAKEFRTLIVGQAWPALEGVQ